MLENIRIFGNLGTIADVPVRLASDGVNACGGIAIINPLDTDVLSIVMTVEFLRFLKVNPMAATAVIMHEVGHHALGHLEGVQGFQLKQKNEFEADAYAMAYVDAKNLKDGLLYACRLSIAYVMQFSKFRAWVLGLEMAVRLGSRFFRIGKAGAPVFPTPVFQFPEEQLRKMRMEGLPIPLI